MIEYAEKIDPLPLLVLNDWQIKVQMILILSHSTDVAPGVFHFHAVLTGQAIIHACLSFFSTEIFSWMVKV